MARLEFYVSGGRRRWQLIHSRAGVVVKVADLRGQRDYERPPGRQRSHPAHRVRLACQFQRVAQISVDEWQAALRLRGVCSPLRAPSGVSRWRGEGWHCAPVLKALGKSPPETAVPRCINGGMWAGTGPAPSWNRLGGSRTALQHLRPAFVYISTGLSFSNGY